MLSPVLRGSVIEYSLVTIYRDTAFMFRVDAFGMVFALLSSFLWVIVSIYSIGYMRSLQEHAQTRYFCCFALALMGAVGVALAGNLLTLFMFYEILTISTFPLVVHKETPEAMKAGQKYLIYLMTGAVFILFSMGYVYYISGTMDFAAGGFLQGKGSPQILKVILVCFMIGFGSKAALMPIHEWLPSAMVALTPVSALLHAVAVVKAGVFCVLRVILYVFGPALLKQLNVWAALALYRFFYRYCCKHHCPHPGQPEAQAGVFHHQQPGDDYPRCLPAQCRQRAGRDSVYPVSRVHEDHAVHVFRRYLFKNREKAGQ